MASSQPIGVLHEKQIDGNEIMVREKAGDRSLVLFDSGDEITVQAGDKGIRFLLVSGRPIQEPVAWPRAGRDCLQPCPRSETAPTRWWGVLMASVETA